MYAEGIAQAKQFLTIDPYDEEGHRFLMRLLAESGQRAAALNHYETCCRLLEQELDISPMPETVTLYEQIRSGTLSQSATPSPLPSLAPTTPPPSTPDLYALLSRLDLPEQHLFGVDRVHARLSNVLEAETAPWLIALDGIGGIGKTSLTIELVRQMALSGRFDNIAWASAKQEEFLPGAGLQSTGRPALDQETLADTVLEQLSEKPSLLISAQEKRLNLIRLLKERPYLVVVDNLETVIDYKALVPFLQQLSNPTKFLITSRFSLKPYSDIYCLSLTELGQTDALDFLRHEAETRNMRSLLAAGEAQLNHIYEVAGGNPLALKLVLSQVRFLSLSEIITNLQQAVGKRIDQLYTYIYWQAWSMLDNAARQLFLMLPLNPNCTFAQLLALQELDMDELQTALEQLINLSLVEVGGNIEQRRYRLHRLTETFLLTEVLKWQNPL